MPEHEDKLKVANRCLLTVILLINFYILAAPLWPNVSLWLEKRKASATHGLPYKTRTAGEAASNDMRADIPAGNRLVIPSIILDTPVLSGESSTTVNKGIWNRPRSSTPPEGSNTVLAGHRFSYDGAPSLYHLDKVKVGDTIALYWAQKEYLYKVTETKVVKATAVEVEDPTHDNRVTIYTCTPLLSVKDRLVVIAKEMES